ncbi:MAG: gfo/Idh/MocA family oxidoreductase [Calditrichaeota bacterium]|nr:MAG: gfo/Idh/MocA family oxidoreductase [Calditrichota bacterium]
MKSKLKWGILSTADIATEQVIPAMITSNFCEIQAIASRSAEKAQRVAKQYGIPVSYGSYNELLADENVEAVYIALPNHLHVPWSMKALAVGKHVLVEKPVGLNRTEAEKLLVASQKYPHLKIMEAFMYRFHPQWIKTKALVQNGAIGQIKAIQSAFSFFDDNSESIVNRKDYGGGSLMDIGCYPISLSRFLFDSEPKSVSATIEYHPEFKIDTRTSGILEFDHGSTTFFSSIRSADDQTAKIWGSEGSIEFDIPFNPPANNPTKIWLTRAGNREEIKFAPANQYTLQADAFSRAILENTPVPTSLIDAVNNMHVIDKIFESDAAGKRIIV